MLAVAKCSCIFAKTVLTGSHTSESRGADFRKISSFSYLIKPLVKLHIDALVKKGCQTTTIHNYKK